MSDFIEQVKIQTRFHYATRQDLLPNGDAGERREKSTRKKRKPGAYIYDEARHGFADIPDETCVAGYAAQAVKRWRKFSRKHL